MPSVFTKIINGEITSYKVAETDACIAFLDVFPIQKGHILVVPKKEVDNLFDLDEISYSNLFMFTKRVAKALEKTIPCNRAAVSVIGLEVPHAHIHLIPINSLNDINFTNKKIKFSDDELRKIAKDISSNYSKLF